MSDEEFIDYHAAHLTPAQTDALRYWLTHDDEVLHAVDAIQDAQAVGDAQ